MNDVGGLVVPNEDLWLLAPSICICNCGAVHNRGGPAGLGLT